MAQCIQLALDLLNLFRPCFREETFQRFFLLVIGWLLTPGRHAVTESLIATGLAGKQHHSPFHRFFSEAAWAPEALGYCILPELLKLLPPGAVVRLVVDDTFTLRKGRQVFGVGIHHDAARSSHHYKVLGPGHCWVVLSIAIDLPALGRPVCFPLLFRLYRTEKSMTDAKDFQTKPELAREMLHRVCRWLGKRRIDWLLDGAYCNSVTLKDLPPAVRVIGRMRCDADLCGPASERVYKGRGRPPIYGEPLPSPNEMAADPKAVWKKGAVTGYRKPRSVQYQESVVRWPKVFGEKPIRMVVVKPSRPGLAVQAFFSSEVGTSGLEVLSGYTRRWPIEVSFRELKQFLGLSELVGRTEGTVRRMAPFIGQVYNVVILWFLEAKARGVEVVVPPRPWFLHRQGDSFEDMLRTLQHTLRDGEFLKLLVNPESLENLLSPPPPAPTTLEEAA